MSSTFTNTLSKDGAGTLTLNNSSNDLVAVEVCDMTGKIVMHSNYLYNNGIIHIATKALSTGTFMVKLTSNGESYVQKVVVIK